jgi:hypothetical protein
MRLEIGHDTLQFMIHNYWTIRLHIFFMKLIDILTNEPIWFAECFAYKGKSEVVPVI